MFLLELGLSYDTERTLPFSVENQSQNSLTNSTKIALLFQQKLLSSCLKDSDIREMGVLV